MTTRQTTLTTTQPLTQAMFLAITADRTEDELRLLAIKCFVLATKPAIYPIPSRRNRWLVLGLAIWQIATGENTLAERCRVLGGDYATGVLADTMVFF